MSKTPVQIANDISHRVAIGAAAQIKHVCSPMPGGHPRFYELLDQIAKLHADKNHDYAAGDDPLSNLKSCTALGLQPFVGAVIRMQDKMCRLQQFVIKKMFTVDESATDTLMDLAVYALLSIILLEEADAEMKANKEALV